MKISFHRKAEEEAENILREDIVRKKLIFQGKVQFVGFRYRSKYLADLLGLTGFVKNLENGDVSMEVQGTAEKIQEMILRLYEAKPIRIDAVKEEDLPVKKEKGFRTYY